MHTSKRYPSRNDSMMNGIWNFIKPYSAKEQRKREPTHCSQVSYEYYHSFSDGITAAEQSSEKSTEHQKNGEMHINSFHEID